MVVNPQPRAGGHRGRTPHGPVGRASNRASLHATRTRTRSDQPAVRLQSGADQASALAAAATPGSQRAAMEELHRGVYAATSQGPQAALLRTWEKFHQAWFSGCLDPYPLTATTIRAVSAMFRAGNYGSYRNYAWDFSGLNSWTKF